LEQIKTGSGLGKLVYHNMGTVAWSIGGVPILSTVTFIVNMPWNWVKGVLGKWYAFFLYSCVVVACSLQSEG
jgi:hypothetical protein